MLFSLDETPVFMIVGKRHKFKLTNLAAFVTNRIGEGGSSESV